MGVLVFGFPFFSFFNGDHHQPELLTPSVSIDKPKFSLGIFVKKYPLNMSNDSVNGLDPVAKSFGAFTLPAGAILV